MKDTADVEQFQQRLSQSEVPPHLHDGLALYLGAGILPGSFLTAVLSGDQASAIRRADDESRKGYGEILRWLTWHAPASAWGSEDAVSDWRASFAQKASA